MSGIFANLIRTDDAGIRHDTFMQIKRSGDRGRDGLGLVTIRDGEIAEDRSIERKASTLREPGFSTKFDGTASQLIGCAYSGDYANSFKKAESVPPFVSYDRTWVVSLDGIVVGLTGQQVADTLSRDGFSCLHDFKGQFALLAFHVSQPNRIYFANTSKPLYGLYDSLGRVVRVASQRKYFESFYHPTRSPQPFEMGPNLYGMLSSEGILSTYPLPVEKGSGSLILCGGGLDSLVASYDVAARFPDEPLALLFFDYGQRAAVPEWKATCEIAHALGKLPGAVQHPLPSFSHTTLVEGNIETTPVAGVPSEWCPARNTVLMAHALSYAEAGNYARIVTGINATAADAYADNEKEWLNKCRSLVPYAVNDRSIDLVAPLENLTKTEIVKLGKVLKVPWTSWSCYGGGEKHCGECSSCRARRAAFRGAGVKDSTEYEYTP